MGRLERARADSNRIVALFFLHDPSAQRVLVRHGLAYRRGSVVGCRRRSRELLRKVICEVVNFCVARGFEIDFEVYRRRVGVVKAAQAAVKPHAAKEEPPSLGRYGGHVIWAVDEG